jgi:hypothetical protein
MTPEDWEAMFESEGGRCPIEGCGQRMTKAHERPPGQRHIVDTDAVVDHEHRTGLVNTLICARCNMVMGKNHNDPALMIGQAKWVDTYHSADFFPERTA